MTTVEKRGAKRVVTLVTPEGVPLRMDLAGMGDRFAALIIDIMLGHGAVIAVILTVVFTTGVGRDLDGLFSVIILLMFFVRAPYYIFFELLWQGRTPGKRALKLQVVDRKGGELHAGAVVARNLMREIEVFIPMSLLLIITFSEEVDPQYWLYAVWLAVVLALPFFNAYRMRAGDMIAGTIVLYRPKPVLDGELAQAGHDFQFSARHLDAYGAYELQVLEDVLRNENRPDRQKVRRDITRRIIRKIGYESTVRDSDADRFLEAFYAAQRAHLEQRQMFGERREDKHYRAADAPADGAPEHKTG